MSFLNGDRARAHKVDRKRRFRRSEIRLLRRVSTPVVEARVEAPLVTEFAIAPVRLPTDATTIV